MSIENISKKALDEQRIFESEVWIKRENFNELVNHVISNYMSKKEHELKVKELEQEVTKHKKIVDVVINVKGDNGDISEPQTKKLQFLMKHPQFLDKFNLDYFELSNGKIIFWGDDKFREQLVYLHILAKLGHKEDVEKLGQILIEKFLSSKKDEEIFEIAINIIKLKETEIFSKLVTTLSIDVELKSKIACIVAYFGTLQQMGIIIPDYGKGKTPFFRSPYCLYKYFGNINYENWNLSILTWAVYGNNLEIIKWCLKHELNNDSKNKSWGYDFKSYSTFRSAEFSFSKECIEYLWNQGEQGKYLLRLFDETNYQIMVKSSQLNQEKDLSSLIKNPEKTSDISLDECKKIMNDLL